MKNKLNSQNKTEIEQGRLILKSLGYKSALGYMKSRGWSIESVLWLLFKLEMKGS